MSHDKYVCREITSYICVLLVILTYIMVVTMATTLLVSGYTTDNDHVVIPSNCTVIYPVVERVDGDQLKALVRVDNHTTITLSYSYSTHLYNTGDVVPCFKSSKGRVSYTPIKKAPEMKMILLLFGWIVFTVLCIISVILTCGVFILVTTRPETMGNIIYNAHTYN
jgi:hypothetical protein